MKNSKFNDIFNIYTSNNANNSNNSIDVINEFFKKKENPSEVKLSKDDIKNIAKVGFKFLKDNDLDTVEKRKSVIEAAIKGDSSDQIVAGLINAIKTELNKIANASTETSTKDEAPTKPAETATSAKTATPAG